MRQAYLIAATLAFASGASSASAQSTAHNGWQCSVEGEWMELYYDLPAPVMAHGITLEGADAKPIRFSYKYLAGKDIYSTYASFDMALGEHLKLRHDGEAHGVILYDITQNGQRIARREEHGLEPAADIMKALTRNKDGGDLQIVLYDYEPERLNHATFTLPLTGFATAGQAAILILRGPRDKTKAVACP